MKKLKMLMDQYLYPDFQDNWDDKIFRKRILKHIMDDSIILDLGAG